MTKCYIDANVLVYFKDITAVKHKESILLLKKLLINKVDMCVSILVLDEFIHATVLTLRTTGQKDALEKARVMFLEILNLPHLFIVSAPLEIEKQKEVFDFMEKYSLKPRDAYHLLTAISSEVDSFATFDQDFKKVFKAKVLKKAS